LALTIEEVRATAAGLAVGSGAAGW
jgi:hypothetical protein